MTRRTSIERAYSSLLTLSAMVAVSAIASESNAQLDAAVGPGLDAGANAGDAGDGGLALGGKLGCALNSVVPNFGVNYGEDADEGWEVIEGDPLLIATGPEGQIGVWVCQPNDDSPVAQYFSETDWANFVHFTPEGGEAIVYANPYGEESGYENPPEPFTAVSQTTATVGTEHTITTVVALGEDAELTRIVTYVEGSYSYKLHWELKNVSASNLNGLHFFNGGDATFGGDDSARSWWSGTLNRVYLSNESFSSSGTMALSGSTATPATHYFGGDYWDGLGLASAGLLTDTADPEYDDAGYQLQWDRSTLAPGQTWTIEAFESWSDPSFITVLAPGQRTVTPGSSVNLSFVVHNLDTDEHTFDLSAATGLTWAASVVGNPAITLPGLASQSVTVQVEVPEDAVVDTLERVTLTAADNTLNISSASAADLQVFAPQYTLTPTTVDFGWVGVGETGTRTLTFENTGSTAEIGDLSSISGLTAPFALGATTCSNATIATGESCLIEIIFTPSSEGSYQASPEIPVLAPEVSTIVVHLQATSEVFSVADGGVWPVTSEETWAGSPDSGVLTSESPTTVEDTSAAPVDTADTDVQTADTDVLTSEGGDTSIVPVDTANTEAVTSENVEPTEGNTAVGDTGSASVGAGWDAGGTEPTVTEGSTTDGNDVSITPVETTEEAVATTDNDGDDETTVVVDAGPDAGGFLGSNGDDDGCSCRTAGSKPSSSLAWLAPLALGMAYRSRRRLARR